MIALLREWFNPKDPLVLSQVYLIGLNALGFADYFNALFICALEIPLGLVIGLLCFSRSAHTASRYLVEIARQSAVLVVLLFMLFAALHANERGPLLDDAWNRLRVPLLGGGIYYLVHFAPRIRNALSADDPVAAWVRSVIAPLFPLWFVLLLSVAGAFALFPFFVQGNDSVATHRGSMIALTALTATVRILLTHAFARTRVSDKINAQYFAASRA
jgi:hypothetical protein